MPTIKRFEDVDAWKTGRLLAQRIYALTDAGHWSRDFALKDQIRRSSISIMSNIAEGFETGSDPQFARYLAYAKGSAGELRAQLYVAFDAHYVDEESFKSLRELAEQCSRQLYGLIAYLQTGQGTRRVKDDAGIYPEDQDDPGWRQQF